MINADNRQDVAKNSEKVESLVRETLRLDDQLLVRLGDVGAGVDHEAASSPDMEKARIENLGKRFVIEV